LKKGIEGLSGQVFLYLVFQTTLAKPHSKCLPPFLYTGSDSSGDHYYPKMDYAPDDLADYIIATAADMLKEMVWDIMEVPHPNAPRGAKGFSEMTSSAAPPAILSAIHNAIGVWITDSPATPEKILRALEAAGKGKKEKGEKKIFLKGN